MKAIFFSLSLFICLSFTNTAGDSTRDNYSNSDIVNFHLVSDSVYRSGQPDKDQYLIKDSLPFRSVLNLRLFATDRRASKSSKLEFYQVRISGFSMNEKDIIKCLRILRNSPKPILIHCKAGSDRTGAIVAAYRMVEQGWSKEDAIAEFKNPVFGYNDFWFPNLEKLLWNIDLNEIRNKLQNL